MAKIIEVHTRTNDEAAAHRLAEVVGERRQAACVHVRGPETSRFGWEGRVVTDTEWQVVAVTTEDRAEDVVATFTEIHSYELPAITWQKVRTTKRFARWVAQETSAD